MILNIWLTTSIFFWVRSEVICQETFWFQPLLCLFLRWWPHSAMWLALFIFLITTTRDRWIIPSFWFRAMCCMLSTWCVITNCGQQHGSFLLFSEYFFKPCWRKTLPETIPIFEIVPLPSLYFMLSLLFSLLSSSWVVIAVCDYFSPVKVLKIL